MKIYIQTLKVHLQITKLHFLKEPIEYANHKQQPFKRLNKKLVLLKRFSLFNETHQNMHESYESTRSYNLVKSPMFAEA